MNIIILSKSIILTKGLSYILKENHIENIKEIQNIYEIENEVEKENEVIIVDMSTIEIDTIHNISRKILAISLDENKEQFKSILDKGIDGYVVCKDDYEPIVFALKSILKGKKYYDGSMVGCLVESEKNININFNNNSLTKRENEILKELGKGKSNKEIAFSLDISENTVKKHIRSIFDKLNLEDRTQAALYSHYIKK